MMDISPFGTSVRTARLRAGLTQRQLAERAHTAQPHVARIERGGGNPTVDTLQRLVDAAGFELRIEITPKRVSDPVVDAYKRDVDRGLLRENLKKSPAQRAKTVAEMARFFAEARTAGRLTRPRKK